MQLKSANTITSIIIRHPYLSVILICLISTPLYFASLDPVRSGTLWIIVGTLIFFSIKLVIEFSESKQFDKKETATLIVAILVIIFTSTYLYSLSENKHLWHLLGGFAVVLTLYWFSDRKNNSESLNIFLISGLGFVLKIHYVLITSILDRQHDVLFFGGNAGHAAYIEYILNYHSLPNVNPQELWQSYHPPLHHIASAIWIGFNEKLLMVDHNASRESLQIPALIYSMLIIIISIRIMKYFKLKAHALYLPLIILNFHPSIIHFAGSINNDPLATVFVMGAILTTLQWYEKQTTRNIIKIALMIGLGMMTKISAGIVAPSVAFMFLIVLINRVKNKDNIRKLLTQYFIFGIICIPLGLWYPIRNTIRWGLPLLYVSKIPENTIQKIDIPFWNRITDFSSYQFKNVYEQWKFIEDGSIKGYNEFNPIIAAIKTSVFGEYLNDSVFKYSNGINPSFFAYFMFWIAVIIAIIATFAFVHLITSKRLRSSLNTTCRIGIFFLTVFIFSSMISYYKLANDYPFVCTMDFRYIVPLVPISLTLIGNWTDKYLFSNNRLRLVSTVTLYICFIIFAFCTTIFIGAIGFI